MAIECISPRPPSCAREPMEIRPGLTARSQFTAKTEVGGPGWTITIIGWWRLREPRLQHL
jgi:hypothetical protein